MCLGSVSHQHCFKLKTKDGRFCSESPHVLLNTQSPKRGSSGYKGLKAFLTRDEQGRGPCDENEGLDNFQRECKPSLQESNQ